MSAISLVLLLFLSHVTTLNAQPPVLRYSYCFNRGNYTNTSTYLSSFNTLVSEITSNTEIEYGFYNLSHGQNPDRVSLIGLCRGDIKPNECRSCLNNASILVPKSCLNEKEAMGGYDECFLRYSNRSILGVMEDDVSKYLWNPDNATEPDKFTQLVSELLQGLRDKAASGDSLRKFATANQSSGYQTVFGAVQCTPDLSQQNCLNCLSMAISEVPSCCTSKRGGRVIKPSCNIRYENYVFYNNLPEESSPPPSPSPPSSLPPPPMSITSTGGDSNRSRIVIIVVAVLAIAFIIVLSSICAYSRVRKSRKTLEIELEDNQVEITPTESLQFDFHTIRVATDDFSVENKLGQGGFGAVYKGRLSNGKEIAVKRLSIDSEQGDSEFKNEVLLVAKLQHRNLVKLLGFCLEKRERVLVYEFLPNKSLDYLLFDPKQRPRLNWEMRYKIIGGIARGLLYLHEDSRLRIIHRDLKASNILLDEEMNPKISDFGMAKLFSINQTQSNTGRIVGTYGYMAPEYALYGQFSLKSDVFSFGVLVLEIVSGKRNNTNFHEENAHDLLSFAWKNWRERTTSNIIDSLLSDGSSREMTRCIHIGLLCVQEIIADRPTMANVALMLSSYSVSLPLPSQPAFLTSYRIIPDMQSGESSSGVTRSSERDTNTSSIQASSGREKNSVQE